MTTSPTTPPTETAPDDTTLYEWAVDLTDQLLSQVNKEGTIPFADRGERVKSALETAAGAASTWGQFVARVTRKLQIPVAGDWLAAKIAELDQRLRDGALFYRWARMVERDALYIVALAQERGRSRATTAKAKKPKPGAEAADPKPSKKDEDPNCLPF